MALKICWIKAGGFVPLDYGGRIRSFQMLRELATRHKVTVITFYPAMADDPHASLVPLFDELILVPMSMPPKGSVAEMFAYARLLTAAHAYTIEKFYGPEVRRAVAELFARKSFDAIICDFMVPAGLLDWSGKTPIVLFTHNVEAEVYKRQCKLSKNPVRKLMFWLEYVRLASAEKHYAERAAHVLAVSESNKQFFSRYAGSDKVTLLPTGVDVDYFRPATDQEEEHTLVFTGSMDWLPNYDAMDWFYREILPLIRAEIPTVQIYMVGRNPPAALRNLVAGSPDVHLTGRVEDVRPYMNRGSIFVLPMRSGSGTRLKVFEAMASGKAIVSTPIGAEGLPVTDSKDILLATEPKAFADHVIRLCRDEPLRKALGANARALAESGFSWRASTDVLEQAVYRSLPKNAAAPRA